MSGRAAGREGGGEGEVAPLSLSLSSCPVQKSMNVIQQLARSAGSMAQSDGPPRRARMVMVPASLVLMLPAALQVACLDP